LKNKDYTIKIWRMCKEEVKYYTESTTPLPFHLKCIKKIEINPSLNFPLSLAIDYNNSIISFPLMGLIELISYKDCKYH